MRGLASSRALYDTLADTYDQHFEVPHRRAYDELAWDAVTAVLPASPGIVVDAGTGVGRWARRLISLGHDVIGIEPAPRMADRAQELEASGRFRLVRAGVDDVELPTASVDAVMAIGSLQYTQRPEVAIRHLAEWLKPGGSLTVLADSYHALIVELLRAGRTEEAAERARTRRGVWQQGELSAELHLLDVASLVAAFEAADLEVVLTAGLLVGATALPAGALRGELERDFVGRLHVERELSRRAELADYGKQLLVIGRR